MTCLSTLHRSVQAFLGDRPVQTAPMPKLKPQPRQGLRGPWRQRNQQQKPPLGLLEVQPQIEDEAFSMELPFELKVPHSPSYDLIFVSLVVLARKELQSLINLYTD